MSDIVTIGDALHTVLGRIENLRVHRYPPDGVSELPAAFLYPENGILQQVAQDGAHNTHNWTFDILAQRQNIAESVERIEPYLDAFQTVMWQDLNADVSTLRQAITHVGTSEPITYRFVAYELAGVPLFGYRVTIPTKTKKVII